MKKRFVTISVFVLLLFATVSTGFAQDVLLGPRLTGNMNIFNEKGLTGTWNGIGIGIGGTVDVSFSKHIGLMANLTFYDMRSFSNSVTNNNQTVENDASLGYITIDPLFKTEFSGFYIVAGPSLGIKINSSQTQTVTNANAEPQVTDLAFTTNTMKFDIVVGTGYTFTLSQNSMYMGTDFMACIPLTNLYDAPGKSTSVFTLKLGVSLKFKL